MCVQRRISTHIFVAVSPSCTRAPPPPSLLRSFFSHLCSSWDIQNISTRTHTHTHTGSGVQFGTGQRCLLVKEGKKGWTLLLTGMSAPAALQSSCRYYISLPAVHTHTHTHTHTRTHTRTHTHTHTHTHQRTFSLSHTLENSITHSLTHTSEYKYTQSHREGRHLRKHIRPLNRERDWCLKDTKFSNHCGDKVLHELTLRYYMR